MYKIVLSSTSEKFLRKLPKKQAEIILTKLYSIRFEPFRYIARLKGTKLWKLRMGSYRAELDIIIKSQTIFVVRAGHRRNVYKQD